MEFFKIKLFEEAYCQQKKEQNKKIEKKLYTKNFYLGKNFESKYFFNSHIFSTKKHFVREKIDDDKTFEVKNIINVIFYFMILQEKLGIEIFSKIEIWIEKISRGKMKKVV